ncbi:MAG: holin-associated N-acetylmuramidase [Paracoccaceae bacterium]
MQNVQEIAEAIVAREGGFVNDPDDPGGATKFGVTVQTMRRLGIDLNADKKVDVRDVKLLSRLQVVDIFVRHYFDKPGIDGLPDVLQPSVFDMYVNAGANGVRILQRLLNDMGFDLVVDGAIGPKTCSAAKTAGARDPMLLRDAYGIARRNYYFGLADNRPSSRKFARTRSGTKGGWIRRAEEFLTPRYHLTQAEFEQRTMSWG